MLNYLINLINTLLLMKTQERLIYPYEEQASYSTVNFVKMAITYFGYKPEII